MLVCVNEPSAGAYYGSVVASPYGKMVFEKLFEYKNIKKDFEGSESFIVVPDVVGKSLSQAIIELDNQKINYEIAGEGGVIVSQFPSGGSVVSKSSYISIVTN